MMPFLNRYIEIPNCRKLYLNRRYEILYIKIGINGILLGRNVKNGVFFH